MSQEFDVRHAERKVFRSAFDDGLWDVLIGCVVLMFAVGPFLGRLGLGDFWSSAAFIPVWGVAYLIVRMVRKRVVVPRIGVVKLGRSQISRLLRFNVVIMVVLLLGLVLGLISAGKVDQPILFLARPLLAALGVTADWAVNARGLLSSIRFGLTVVIAFSVAAFFLEFRRLYLYGVLIAASPLIGELLYRKAGVPHHGFPVTFGATALIIMLLGLLNFARLVRETPDRPETLPPQEALNGRPTG